MNKFISDRVLKEAQYILKNNSTVREIAAVFNVSKSTVHKDLKERLLSVDKNIYQKVQDILRNHLEIRHIRGGESTRLKYLKLKKG